MPIDEQVAKIGLYAFAWVVFVCLIVFAHRVSRKRSRPSGSGPPTKLPGLWPPMIQDRYRALDAAGRMRWWRRFRLVHMLVVWPLIAAAAVVGMAMNNVGAAIILAAFAGILSLWAVLSA